MCSKKPVTQSSRRKRFINVISSTIHGGKKNTWYAGLLACVLSFALACTVAFPQTAQADVRKSDIIAGTTVESRGLSVALCPNISANYAIAMNSDGTVYYERSAYDSSQIASVTKIMTAIVAMEYDPTYSIKVTVTDAAAAIGESSAGLQSGDVLDMKSALKAMLVASGNDAALSIATAVGRDMLSNDGEDSATDSACVARFVQAMNDKAAELGLTNSEFTNPHGLDYDEYASTLHSCAADVATEVKHAMQNQVFRDTVKLDTADITVTRGTEKVSISLESTDELLTTYSGTIGVKTGYTELAGACYAGANSHEGEEYYVVVLGSSDEEQRFTDAETLWNWIYTHKKNYQLISCAKSVSTTINGSTQNYPIVATVAHADWIDKTIQATVADPSQTVPVFDWDGNVSQTADFNTVTGNVHKGDKLGTLTFKQHNEVIATVDIIAAEDVNAPDFLTGVSIWWQRLFGGCSGAQQTAASVLLNQTTLLVDKSGTTTS